MQRNTAALLCFIICLLSLVTALPARAGGDRPVVAYTGVYLMGSRATESRFPVFIRNRDRVRDALRTELQRIDGQHTLPFDLLFTTDMEGVKQRIDGSLSLALVVVRDDVSAESFRAAGATVNKTIVNVGLTAIIYDTRTVDGKERNTVLFSFPLVGYSQRLDGERQCGDGEIDSLFVESAASALRENIVRRMAGAALTDVAGVVTAAAAGSATVSIGSTDGIEEGQNVVFLADGRKAASGPVVKLLRNSAVVSTPAGFAARSGMKVRAANIRAASDDTYQVVDARVSSKKAARFFPQEIVAPQAAQWFSNFLTERGGKAVLPSRVGGEWDQRATGSAFSLLARDGRQHVFELPPPKYPITLDITGVSSKITESSDINDICMFKAWMKVSIPTRNYEKEFDIFSSKCLIRGAQSFEEKNELFDLLYQLTAKIAREAEL